MTSSPFAYSTPDLSISPQSLRQQAFQHIIEGGDPNFEGKKVVGLYQAAIDKSEKEYGPTAGYTAQLYFEMGNYAFDISNFTLANNALTKALQINPNLIAARLRLAQLDEVAKRPDSAREQMRQLLIRHGDNKVAQNKLIALMQKSDPVGATRQAYLFQRQSNSSVPKFLSQPHPEVVKPPQEAVAEMKTAPPKLEQAKVEPPNKPIVSVKKPEAAAASKVEPTTISTEQSDSQISSVLSMRAHHLKPLAQPASPKPVANENKNPDPNASASVTANLSPSAQAAHTEEQLRKEKIELLQKELLLEQQLKAFHSSSASLNYSAQANARKSDGGTARPKKHKSAPSSSDAPKVASLHPSEGHKSSHKSGGGTMLIPPPPPTSLVLPGPSFPMAMPLRPELTNQTVQIKTAAKIMKQPKPKPPAEAKSGAEEKPPEAKAEKPRVAPTGSEEADPEFLLKWAGTQKKKK